MARRCRLRSASCRSRSARARSAWACSARSRAARWRSARPRGGARLCLPGLHSGCTLLAVISRPFRWLALGRTGQQALILGGGGPEAEAGPFDRAGQGAGGQLGRDLRIGDRGAEGGGHLLLQRPGRVRQAGQRLPGQRGDQLAALPGQFAQPPAVQRVARLLQAGAELSQPRGGARVVAHQPVDDPRRAGRLAQAGDRPRGCRVAGRAGPRRELAPAPDEFRRIARVQFRGGLARQPGVTGVAGVVSGHSPIVPRMA